MKPGLLILMATLAMTGDSQPAAGPSKSPCGRRRYRPTALEQILPVFWSDPHSALPEEGGQSEYDPTVGAETEAALGDYDITDDVAGMVAALLTIVAVPGVT
jgi:hypothetical protein